jgi:hypothetical protein
VFRRPGELRTRLEVAVLDTPGGLCQVPERPRQRAREEPGDHEPDEQREAADGDEDEDAAPDAARDLVDALRDADDAHGNAFVRDRHRGEEQVLAERVAVPPSLGALPADRGPDLGP